MTIDYTADYTPLLSFEEVLLLLHQDGEVVTCHTSDANGFEKVTVLGFREAYKGLEPDCEFVAYSKTRSYPYDHSSKLGEFDSEEEAIDFLMNYLF